MQISESGEIAEGNKFGICLILPECAFRAEIPRDEMIEKLADIDDQLTAQGVPPEDDVRFDVMVSNARMISLMLARKQLPDSSVAISDIAYSFAYALGKMIGLDALNGIRGLTGGFLRNRLRINPCLAEFDFQIESSKFSNKMDSFGEDDDWAADAGNITYH